METREIPFGLLFALASNEEAMRKFSMLTSEEKHRIADITHVVNSKKEMKRLVQKIADDELFWKM